MEVRSMMQLPVIAGLHSDLSLRKEAIESSEIALFLLKHDSVSLWVDSTRMFSCP